MPSAGPAAGRGTRLATPGACAAVAALAASFGLIGGDALWLVPLGREVAHGHLPGSVSFATAPSSGWDDVPALAQLVFFALYRAFGGERGLVVAQTLGVAVAFAALARGLVARATGGAALVISGLVLAGSLPTVVITSSAVFSLALFSVLLTLLEAEADAPGRRIWLAVPLLALWGNLHGQVLAGWGLLACFLVLERARRDPRTAALVLGAATLAPFANPTLWRTPGYYRGIFGSEVARRGDQLWQPLSSDTFDLLLVAAAAALAVLAVLAVRRGDPPRVWELVAAAGLGAATVHVARTGPELLLVLAYPAARGLRLGEPKPRLVALAAAVVFAGAVASLVRGPFDPGSRSLAREAARDGRPVLATGLLGQQVAVDGGRIWLDNPIDAFRRADQRVYLDWLDGASSGRGAISHAALVLVQTRSSAGGAAARDPRLELVRRDANAALYAVRRAGR